MKRKAKRQLELQRVKKDGRQLQVTNILVINK